MATVKYPIILWMNQNQCSNEQISYTCLWRVDLATLIIIFVATIYSSLPSRETFVYFKCTP